MYIKGPEDMQGKKCNKKLPDLSAIESLSIAADYLRSRDPVS